MADEKTGNGPARIDTLPLDAVDARRAYKTIDTTMRQLWRAIDDLATVMPPHPTYYRVTIFGSSRMHRGDPVYGEVRRLAMRLAEMGVDIITGGGPGLMQAANEGERLGDVADVTRSYGLNVELPHEQEANPYVERLFHHGTFFSRLHHFVRLSSAYVVMPGGIGTTLEALLVWQLIQVGHLKDRPLIMVGDMWTELIEWGRKNWLSGPRNLADPADLAIPQCVDSVDRAVEIIRESLEMWSPAPDSDVAARTSEAEG